MSVLSFASTSSFSVPCISLSVVFFIILTGTSSPCLATITNTSRNKLSVDYYAKSCPQLENLVGSVTSQQFKESPVSGPATIRLLFHDCFVQVSTYLDTNQRALIGDY